MKFIQKKLNLKVQNLVQLILQRICFGKNDDNLPSTPIQLDMSNEKNFDKSDTPNVSNMTRV